MRINTSMKNELNAIQEHPVEIQLKENVKLNKTTIDALKEAQNDD